MTYTTTIRMYETSRETSTNTYPRCHFTDTECHKQAGTSGFCRQHEAVMRGRLQRTSDGIPTGRRPKMTPEQITEARRMKSAFKSPRAIAAHFGVSVETLHRVTAR